MSPAKKAANLLAVAVPFAAFVTALALLWHSAVDWRDLLVMFVFYVITGYGITAGFHRLLTHRAFQTPKWVEYAFATAGSMAMQGQVITWVADHRKHHAHTDREGDPHSPHVGRGAGFFGAVRGFFHAHVGWFFSEDGRAERTRYARDLCEDSGMVRIHRLFPVLVLAGLAIPAVVDSGLHGWTLEGAARGVLWGGLVRMFALHHVTWSINSVCHFMGRRRFRTDDESRNVFWLSVLSFGEAWHHNHHTFPRSAYHGLRRWELAADPTAWLVRLLRRLGLAWNVVEITPERQRELEVA